MANNFTMDPVTSPSPAATAAPDNTVTELDIIDSAANPERVTTDEGTVQERSITDLIKADQYAKSQEIGDNPLHGLRISRCKPAGP